MDAKKIGRGVIVKRELPKAIWVEPTNVCNLQCSFCFQSNSSMTRKKGLMDFETFKKIVNEVASFKPEICLHHSGESLLHGDLNKFIKYAKTNGLKVGLTTNGTLLKKDNFSILDSDVDILNVSLAGVSDEDYKRIRSESSYGELKADIIKLASEKQKRKLKVEIYVNVIETQANRKQIKKLKEEFRSVEGINGVIVRKLMTWSGRVSLKGMKVRGVHSMVMGLLIKGNRYRKVVMKKSLCKSILNGCGILWDGTVVPCCYDFNAEINLGNIKKESFLDIWNGDGAEEIRAMLKSMKRTRAHKVCGPCIFSR